MLFGFDRCFNNKTEKGMKTLPFLAVRPLPVFSKPVLFLAALLQVSLSSSPSGPSALIDRRGRGLHAAWSQAAALIDPKALQARACSYTTMLLLRLLLLLLLLTVTRQCCDDAAAAAMVPMLLLTATR